MIRSKISSCWQLRWPAVAKKNFNLFLIGIVRRRFEQRWFNGGEHSIFYSLFSNEHVKFKFLNLSMLRIIFSFVWKVFFRSSLFGRKNKNDFTYQTIVTPEKINSSNFSLDWTTSSRRDVKSTVSFADGSFSKRYTWQLSIQSLASQLLIVNFRWNLCKKLLLPFKNLRFMAEKVKSEKREWEKLCLILY